MSTVYDWVTVGIFAGLIVLYLKRSEAEYPRDSLWQYLCASLACAFANYLGNEGNHILAVILIVGTLGYVLLALKPFHPPEAD